MYQVINPEQLGKILIVNPEKQICQPATDFFNGMIVLADFADDIAAQKPTQDMMPIPGPPKTKKRIDRDEVCRLRNEGKKISQIAVLMDCSSQTVTNILTKLREEGRLDECK